MTDKSRIKLSCRAAVELALLFLYTSEEENLISPIGKSVEIGVLEKHRVAEDFIGKIKENICSLGLE